MFSPIHFSGALFGLAITAVSAVVIPTNQPFMKINEITYKDGMVYADRTIFPLDDIEVRIADWRATVVPIGKDTPTCQTIPGPMIHEGWSDYEAGEYMRDMTLDEWVGDPGCLARMGDGEHAMFMNWTPRDGGQSVVHAIKFYK